MSHPLASPEEDLADQCDWQPALGDERVVELAESAALPGPVFVAKLLDLELFLSI